MKLQRILACATLSLAFAFAAAGAHASTNLVQNGDFEANFTSGPAFETAPLGWTLSPALADSDFYVGGGTQYGSYSGINSANFGAFGNYDDELSQDISTIAGHTYTVSFELAHFNTDSQNDFSASFGGVQGLSLVDTSAFGYTRESFTTTATSSSTALAFYGREVPGWYELDHVSVVDLAAVPEPSTWLLMIAGLGGVGLMLRRARKTLGFKGQGALAV